MAEAVSSFEIISKSSSHITYKMTTTYAGVTANIYGVKGTQRTTLQQYSRLVSGDRTTINFNGNAFTDFEIWFSVFSGGQYHQSRFSWSSLTEVNYKTISFVERVTNILDLTWTVPSAQVLSYDVYYRTSADNIVFIANVVEPNYTHDTDATGIPGNTTIGHTVVARYSSGDSDMAHGQQTYITKTVEMLYTLRDLEDLRSKPISYYDSRVLVLGADIDFAYDYPGGSFGWIPIPIYCDFDGGNHTIYNIYIDKSQSVLEPTAMFFDARNQRTGSKLYIEIKNLTLDYTLLQGVNVYGLTNRPLCIDNVHIRGILRAKNHAYALPSMYEGVHLNAGARRLTCTNTTFEGVILAGVVVAGFPSIGVNLARVQPYIYNTHIRGAMYLTSYPYYRSTSFCEPIAEEYGYEDAFNSDVRLRMSGFTSLLGTQSTIKNCSTSLLMRTDLKGVDVSAFIGDAYFVLDQSTHDSKTTVIISECYSSGWILAEQANRITGFLNRTSEYMKNYSTLKIHDCFTSVNIRIRETSFPQSSALKSALLGDLSTEVQIARIHVVGRADPRYSSSGYIWEDGDDTGGSLMLQDTFADAEKLQMPVGPDRDQNGNPLPKGSDRLSTAQMQEEQSFTNFNFNAIWEIDLNHKHPVLQRNPFVIPPRPTCWMWRTDDTGEYDPNTDPDLTPVKVYYNLKASSSKGVAHLVLTQEDISKTGMPVSTSIGILYVYSIPIEDLGKIIQVSDSVFYGVRLSTSKGVRVLPSFTTIEDNYIKFEGNTGNYGYLFKP